MALRVDGSSSGSSLGSNQLGVSATQDGDQLDPAEIAAKAAVAAAAAEAQIAALIASAVSPTAKSSSSFASPKTPIMKLSGNDSTLTSQEKALLLQDKAQGNQTEKTPKVAIDPRLLSIYSNLKA